LGVIKKTGKRIFNWGMALFLLPLLIAAVHQLILMLPSLGKEGWQSWWIYAIGVGVYILIELIFHKPMWVYVFGHEMTHAISGILSGAKLLKFKATSKGGEVQLSKSNLFVALSPYVIPIYMVMVVGLYALVKIWIKAPEITFGFQFFLGLTLAFHLSLTFMALHRRQPDLKILGYFLSSTLIWLGNALILGILCISLFKKTPSFQQFGQALGQETLLLWKLAFKYGVQGATYIFSWIHSHIH
jgi:hypothetical protein